MALRATRVRGTPSLKMTANGAYSERALLFIGYTISNSPATPAARRKLFIGIANGLSNSMRRPYARSLRHGIARRSISRSTNVVSTPSAVMVMMPTNMFSMRSVSHEVQIR